MITKLLSTAVKFYLRSQVSQVKDLQVKISGKNRQILTGYIPQVFLSCNKGVYQGLHLREVEINGNDIAVNLPEVLKKKPLRLLEPIVVRVKLGLDANDLLASLDSNLLQSGLTDLWEMILATKKDSQNLELNDSIINWDNIAIANQQLTFSGTYKDEFGQDSKLNLLTRVTLSNNHTLCLFPLKIRINSNAAEELADKLEIDLGKDVNIEELVVEASQILCLGDITVNS